MLNKRNNIFFILLAIFLLPLLFVFAKEEWTTSLIVNFSGLVSLLLFSFQVFLGIPEISRIITRDRVDVIRAHVLLGIFGVIAILAHPISFFVVYSPTISALLNFGFNSPANLALSLGKISFILFFIVWISSSILKSKLPYKYWRLSHLITYPLVIATIMHAYMIGTYVSGDIVVKYWFMLLSALVFLSILYRFLSVSFLQKNYIITEMVQIETGVTLYTLKPEKDKIKVRSGQFIYLSLEGELLSHPFTVLSAKESGEIQICIKSFGEFTKKLSLCNVNTKVQISDSHGIFLENPSSKRVVCIAGGIGITPFVYYVLNKGDSNVSLHYFTRNKSTAYFRNEISSTLKDEYKEYFSDEKKTTPKSFILDIGQDDIDQAEFYLCGPPSLVRDLIKELKNKGVRKNRIFTEQFSF